MNFQFSSVKKELFERYPNKKTEKDLGKENLSPIFVIRRCKFKEYGQRKFLVKENEIT